MPSPQEYKSIYNRADFHTQYTYTGQDLGMTCSQSGTSFALWSPLAKEVCLLLYKDGSQSPCCARMPMKRCEQGVWRYETADCLEGLYYQYWIDHGDSAVIAADPYARGCGLNGRRSLVLELSHTDPEGWAQDCAPRLPAENIIYEIHVKEFSWQDAAGFPPEYRGKYKAFTCDHTTLNRDGIHPTGLDYLQQLGITYVQLMPVYDYGSVDESHGTDFNWGYDPVNYNIPEGAYSADPSHGEVRIREFKEMIQALHRRGFRVIMDVVYNHTYSLDSCLNRAVPWYYYRIGENGGISNGSACGNDIASEYPMCANYIVDSVLYWAEQFHIDGFRFDLMGLLDTALMNRIRRALDARFGRGEKLVFGEPWSASKTSMKKPYVQSLQENVQLLDSNIGIFCDKTRDAIKGHVFIADQPGFVNGGKGLEDAVLAGARAWCRPGSPVKAPSQVISYVSAHDNMTLWDKLAVLISDTHHRIQSNKLAAAIYMTCQGSLFFLSGEEWARTKGGLDNTYNAPISVNRLDWERAWQYRELVLYYQGLIALRKQLPGLCDKSSSACRRFLKIWKQEGFVGYLLNNRSDVPGKWDTVCVFYNGRTVPVTQELPEGKWQILLDGDSSFRWKETKIISDHIFIKGTSAVVLGLSGHKE